MYFNEWLYVMILPELLQPGSTTLTSLWDVTLCSVRHTVAKRFATLNVYLHSIWTSFGGTSFTQF